ncbi:MAG: succinate--CoA ligase subunit alpha [Firmicutes bacterium]|nr:succinate--CoA ligase subunit alpha [Bacillota bacterium]
MAILVGSETRVVVQGITGNQGSFHTAQMLAYGTRVVAGTSPSRVGGREHGVPIFATVREAVEKEGANASVVFVPARFATDAALEAIDAGVGVLVLVPEHMPVQDTMAVLAFARRRGVTVVGPNTFGVLSTEGRCKMGIPPNHIYRPGPVGLVARSGTLSYEIAASLSAAGLGQTTAVGIGGDPVAGLTFVDVLERFEADPETRAVVMVGEIGGTAEEVAAEFIHRMTKPVVAYLAGRAAPPGKRMGHAGAIIERGRGTLESKRRALTEAGARVAEMPWEVAGLVREALGARAG